MAKKQFFLLIDTETTIQDHVADFGAVVFDRKGEIHTQCGVLVNDFFGKETLFYDVKADPDCIWSRKGLEKRQENYTKMLQTGTRMLASATAINRWLEKAVGMYDPVLTAYNLPFDEDKCRKSSIDLNMFSERFCLWRASANYFGHTKKYRKFVLESHGFNAPTKLGNMSYKTNAEIMARFIFDNPSLDDEPHTALEDIIYYELPIARFMLQKKRKDELIKLATEKGYNWKDYQVKNHFVAK